MKKKVKIVYSTYYYDEIIKSMLDLSKKILTKSSIDFDTIDVPGSFEVPFEIARSIKEDTVDKKDTVVSFKG